ncbi:MAG: hypothetical protein JW384_01565 [Nitrosomonadaceae bacterium]|jgi:hypothetical protein|nr:hypothetical protein [Nitrosomonadaceae bacterium]
MEFLKIIPLLICSSLIWKISHSTFPFSYKIASIVSVVVAMRSLLLQ